MIIDAKMEKLGAAGIASVVLFLLLAAILFRSPRRRKQAAPGIEPEIVDALSVYLGGNRDTSRLRILAASHPDEVRETILRYQTIVAGRREELCDLTIVLGYVRRWWEEANSANLTKRRIAFSRIAAMAHYEPVRRLAGDVAPNGFRDPDEQIRVDAARILLATAEPVEIVRVFEGTLTDTPGVRSAIGGELARYATQLCENAVPHALQTRKPLDVLRLLVSWERALPQLDVQPLAKHPDPSVRVEVMRLLPYLPTIPANRAAILSCLDDVDEHVRAAATTAADQLRFPNKESMTFHGNTFPELENA